MAAIRSSTTNVIALAGGGSAGHVLPALAVARATQTIQPTEFVFYGRANSIEERLCARSELPFRRVPSARIRRYRSSKNILTPAVVTAGILTAATFLMRDRPSVLFAKGGFASVPTAVAARMLGIPVLVHESDHSLGLANRIIAKFATQVLLSFPDTKIAESVAAKSVIVGQIVRWDLATGRPQRFRAQYNIRDDKPVVLIYGGSSGARRINIAVQSSLHKLTEVATVVHVVGTGNYDTAYDKVSDYVQLEYLNEDMVDALWLADLVVARAGANTLAELAALKKPAILIPLPVSVSRGDQDVNARYFVQHNPGVIVPDSELDQSLVRETIHTLKNVEFRPQASLQIPPTNEAAAAAAKILLRLSQAQAALS